MKKKANKPLCWLLLILGIVVFLWMMIFESPDGIIGFILCVGSIYLIIGAIIRLCKTSPRFEKIFFNVLDLLFYLP